MLFLNLERKISRGIQNNEVENKINYAQKALQATFKMLSKAPTTEWSI